MVLAPDIVHLRAMFSRHTLGNRPLRLAVVTASIAIVLVAVTTLNGHNHKISAVWSVRTSLAGDVRSLPDGCKQRQGHPRLDGLHFVEIPTMSGELKLLLLVLPCVGQFEMSDDDNRCWVVTKQAEVRQKSDKRRTAWIGTMLEQESTSPVPA